MISKTVTIIGAGPAGMTAALQLRRAGIEFGIFERAEIGGLLLNAGLVENYPGLERPMSGVELVKRFRSQMTEHGIEIQPFRIDKIEYDGLFKTGRTISKYLIVATGTRPKKLPEDIGRDVRYDIYALLGTKGQKIAVVGGGDAAFDYSLTLAKNNKVVLFVRGERPSCLPLLYYRSKKEPNIDIRFKTSFKDEGFKYVIAAIGREPCIDILPKQLVDKPPTGLYLVGDVNRGSDRQLVIAASDGMLAAHDIIQREIYK